MSHLGNKNLSIPPLTKQNTPPPQMSSSGDVATNSNSNNSRLARDLSMPSPSKTHKTPENQHQQQPQPTNSSTNFWLPNTSSSPTVQPSPYPPKQSSSLASFDSIITNSMLTDPLGGRGMDPTRSSSTAPVRTPGSNAGSNLENAINNIKRNQQLTSVVNRPPPAATAKGPPPTSLTNCNPGTSKQPHHPATSNAQLQQSKQYGMLNHNNKVNNSHKLNSRQPEYLSVDKALKVREEIRQSASMSNRMDVDSVNLQQQQHQQQFNYRLKETNNNLTAKIANSLRKNSFDTDLPPTMSQQTNRINSTTSKPTSSAAATAGSSSNPPTNRPIQPPQHPQHPHQPQRMQHPPQATMNSNISNNKNMPNNKPNMQQNQSQYYHQTWVIFINLFLFFLFTIRMSKFSTSNISLIFIHKSQF